MSFILDALRKSDKKRQETNTPRLDTVHVSLPIAKQRRPLWIYLVLAVLLMNVGGLVWFLNRPSQPGVVDAEIVQQQSALPERGAPVDAEPQLKTVKQPIPQILTEEAARSVSTPESGRPLLGRQVFAIDELPVAVQRRIPQLHMSLHAYSKAGGSVGMVRVNDQILRQGAKLDGKFLLEEIRADGAVFRFDGYSFLLPRN